MGKRLGSALIIYGILNFMVSLAIGSAYIALGAFVWMIIMIALGAWMRARAKDKVINDKRMDRQQELLERMADKLDEQEREKKSRPT